MKNITVVTIGGGTGTPVINEALIYAGVKSIKSIVSVVDSGGTTGRMRTDSKGEEIAYSDALRTMLSFIDPKDRKKPSAINLTKMLRKRNERGQDLGYTIFSHLYDKTIGFNNVKELLTGLTGLNLRGEVLPITSESTNIKFQTISGSIYTGEHELDDKRMSKDIVDRIWLDPKVNIFYQSAELIKNADLIIFACGSLHGSVLVNFLPGGMKEAYKQSGAKKVLVTNLASTRNETHNYEPVDFINIFKKYSGVEKPIDAIIVPNMSRLLFERKFPDVVKMYDEEHSHFLGWEDKDLSKLSNLGVEVIKHDAVLIDPLYHRLRHNPKKLSQAFTKLFKL